MGRCAIGRVRIAWLVHPRAMRFPRLALLAVLLAACGAPREGAPEASPKPGWGVAAAPEDDPGAVRAVPAAAAPEAPRLQAGKPGWGR